jgi:Flavodoxins
MIFNMKKSLLSILSLLITLTMMSCSDNEPKTEIPGNDINTEVPGNLKILVAYFSWGGTTQRMAQQIQQATGADLFRIEPVVPYPTEYTPCTQVAREEKDSNARPAIKNSVSGWDNYDVVFIGCPVWWWTTPMIIHTFCESYNFKDKTVIPFCTYAATYRDETLAEIVNSTPDAAHLQGLGLTSGQINQSAINSWLKNIKVLK